MGFFDGIGKPIKKTSIRDDGQLKITRATFKGVTVFYGSKEQIGHRLPEGSGGYQPVKGLPAIFILNTSKGDKRLLNHEYAHFLWHKKLSSKKKAYWTQTFAKYKKYLNASFQFATEEYFAIYYAYVKTSIIPSHQNHGKPITELVAACKKITGA